MMEAPTTGPSAVPDPPRMTIRRKRTESVNENISGLIYLLR